MTLDLEDDMAPVGRYKTTRVFLDHLAERMERYGITQAQLGKEIGTISPQMSRWFRKGEGGVTPSADYVFALERAFQKLKREKIAEKMNQKP